MKNYNLLITNILKYFICIFISTYFFSCSSASEEVQPTSIKSIPLSPSNLTGIVSTTSISLSWNDNSKNEEGFTIERKTGDNSGNFEVIGTVNSNQTNYVDSNFYTSDILQYRIRAFNSIGTSPEYSNLFTYELKLPEWTIIQDDKFEKSLILQGIDDVFDGKVLTSKVRNLKYFKMEHTRVKDITGIENFVSLEFLLLWDNDFTTINVTQMKRLKILGLSECPVSSIDLTQNTELVEIDFQHNANRFDDPTYPYGKTVGFTSLDLSKNGNMERIYIWTNRITSLDVSKCVNLTDLWIGGSMSQYNKAGGGNPIETLDLSNNSKLNVLVADGCNLKNLNIKNTANKGVPRTCITKNNPNLLQIKVSDVNRINTWRNTLNAAGSPIYNVWYSKDDITQYVE